MKSKPGGFHFAYLPFREDLREPEIKGNEARVVQQEAIDLGLAIVDKLSDKYDPRDFPNPVLQTLYRAIEERALNEKIEPFDDSKTQPDYDLIESEAGYDLYQLNQLLGGYCVQSATKPVRTYTEEFIRASISKNKVRYNPKCYSIS